MAETRLTVFLHDAQWPTSRPDCEAPCIGTVPMCAVTVPWVRQFARRSRGIGDRSNGHGCGRIWASPWRRARAGSLGPRSAASTAPEGRYTDGLPTTISTRPSHEFSVACAQLSKIATFSGTLCPHRACQVQVHNHCNSDSAHPTRRIPSAMTAAPDPKPIRT